MEVVSTGSISLDFATGVGGLPRGRVVEIFGPESIGKTALSYYMIAEEQKKGRAALFCNIEGNFDPFWAQKIAGVDINRNSPNPLVVASADPGSECVELVASAVTSGNFGIIVFDSIGAMLGDKERQPGEKKQAGGQSQLVTHMVKLVAIPADQNGTTVVFLNQLRDKFNATMALTESPGGRAVKHMAAMRIRLRPSKDRFYDTIAGEKIEVGFRVAAKVEKNKASSPNSVAGWNFYNRPYEGKIGIDREQEILDLSLAHGIVDHGGGGYYYHDVFPEDDKGQRRVRGKESVFDYLKQHPEDQDKIRMELMELSRRMSLGVNDG
jgi:recombination protein RecA